VNNRVRKREQKSGAFPLQRGTKQVTRHHRCLKRVGNPAERTLKSLPFNIHIVAKPRADEHMNFNSGDLTKVYSDTSHFSFVIGKQDTNYIKIYMRLWALKYWGIPARLISGLGISNQENLFRKLPAISKTTSGTPCDQNSS
jgi:hypothetical protein